jgi:hypothetical protein
MNKSFAVASIIWFLLGCAVLATVVNRQLNPQHGETNHANQGSTHGLTTRDRDSSTTLNTDRAIDKFLIVNRKVS